jgi:hypothetical protein
MQKFMRWAALSSIVVCASLASAQNTNSGDIRGTVTDPSGAVIPDVTVTAKDVDKGVVKTFATDSAGLYDTGSIVPDHYLITFTKDGFDTFVRGPITLDVGTQTINAELKVGSTQQQVVVRTDVQLIQTESGAQEDTLASETMAQLPQVGADWENFLTFLPGTAGTPENASSTTTPGAGALSVNGNLPFETVLADGATTTLPMSQNSDVTVFETTAEVKVSDSAFSAQYGVGDIIYNQITKGGTNQFHGAGYEYFQNNALNAAPYEFTTLKTPTPYLRYNNYGVAVGGPILRNKLFFYFDYDKTDQFGGANTGSITVPTAAEMSGDFTAPGLPTIYDPTTETIQQTGTHTYTGAQYPNGSLTLPCPCAIRQSFASEYGNGNKIPTAMIDPVAQKIQAYFPKPNTAGSISDGININNYTYNTPSSDPFTKFFGRIDYDVTTSNRVTISETESDNPAEYLNQGICPVNCQHGDVSRDNAQVSDVWTFSSNFINEARFGFTDQLNFFTPFSINQGIPAALGWAFAKADVFPTVTFNNFDQGNFQPASNAVYKEFVFDPSDVVTLIRGRHVLHFGGEFLINRADSTAWGNINAGTLTYNGDYTSSGGAATTAYDGLDYADFLLGQTQAWTASETPEWGGRWKSPQFFVQDDFKFKPNLTLNLGLRYEIETGWSEVKGNEAAFDPEVVNPANGSLGAIWYGFSHAHGRTSLQAPKYNIVLPRVGFSWEAMPNTVVRGGFGIYAATWSDDTYGGGMGAAFGSSGTYTDTTAGICPIVQLNSNGSTPDTTDPGCGTGNYNSSSLNSKYLTAPTTPDAFNGQTVTYNEYHTPVPTNYQWTVSVERQIGPNFGAELAYVGNHGENLALCTCTNINEVPGNLLGPNDAGNEPYPLFQNINGSTNNNRSNYNAMQAQITKRMSQGLEFNVNYTWSHFLDDQDTSGWGSRGGWQNYQNAHCPDCNYSESNFDIRNMFKGQAIYQLPFGEGRQFVNNNRALDEVIGGWQTSATFQIQDGNPLLITTGSFDSTNDLTAGGYTQYPNLVGLGNWSTQGEPRSARLAEWYNLSAFAVPPAYTYGNFNRNIVTGPGLAVLNGSLGKTFDLWPEHGIKLEVRSDAINVLNHPSFSQPGLVVGPGQSSSITSVTTSAGRSMQLYGRISF